MLSPGSHDSFAFHLCTKKEVAPDVEKTAFAKLAKMKMLAGVTKKTMHRWSVTQTLPFSEQLRAGVRYFDLRLGFRGKTSVSLDSEKKYHDALHFVHGLYGLQIQTGLTEILQFLEGHPKEVVVLHFQHFYNFQPNIHEHCVTLVSRLFREKLCPVMKHASDLTLKQMWRNKWQVIVLYRHKVLPDLMWNARMVVSPWGNVSSSSDLVKFLGSAKNRHDHKFYVSQAVLTPDSSMIAKHVTSSLKDRCAKKASKDVNKWLQSLTPGSHGLNIFMVDFIEMGDFVANVLRLNSCDE